MTTAKQLLTGAGLQDSHWGVRIIAAEERGSFGVNDCVDALSWQTCACGKLDPRIPRQTDVNNPAPLDMHLRELGQEFYCHVTDHEFLEAARTLIAIEKRAAEVLAEVLG